VGREDMHVFEGATEELLHHGLELRLHLVRVADKICASITEIRSLPTA
jgi:hypothetical protein